MLQRYKQKMKLQTINNKYTDLLQNIKDYFDASDNILHNARNKIKLINYNNEELVIKAFKIPNIINQIVYSFFKDSKAKKSYQNSLKISTFVPDAIGYIEFYRFGLLQDSYFISKKFDYDFDIRPSLTENNFQDKTNIFKQFAHFAFQLHQNDIFHEDFSPGNILIKKQNDNYIFKIVDINRMKFKKLNIDDRMRNFAKLWAKDNDLKIITNEYAKIINEDQNKLFQIAQKYSQAHKDKQNLKKRLKGKKVTD